MGEFFCEWAFRLKMVFFLFLFFVLANDWIGGCRFTGLQEIQQKIEGRTSVLNGIYWLPQVVGGTGFIVSS